KWPTCCAVTLAPTNPTFEESGPTRSVSAPVGAPPAVLASPTVAADLPWVGSLAHAMAATPRRMPSLRSVMAQTVTHGACGASQLRCQGGYDETVLRPERLLPFAPHRAARSRREIHPRKSRHPSQDHREWW